MFCLCIYDWAAFSDKKLCWAPPPSPLMATLACCTYCTRYIHIYLYVHSTEKHAAYHWRPANPALDPDVRPTCPCPFHNLAVWRVFFNCLEREKESLATPRPSPYLVSERSANHSSSDKRDLPWATSPVLINLQKPGVTGLGQIALSLRLCYVLTCSDGSGSIKIWAPPVAITRSFDNISASPVFLPVKKTPVSCVYHI